MAHCEKMANLDHETAKTLEFIADNREEILRILEDNYKHRIKHDVLKCGVAGGESRTFYVVGEDMKQQYKLLDGIHGTFPRNNKQNFIILFRGVKINDHILGRVFPDLYNFEDPRDADKALRALWKLYGDYARV